MRSLVALALLGLAIPAASQAPAVAVDTSVARQLAAEWHNVQKPSQDIACLYGHLEGDTIVVDSQALVSGDPGLGCPNPHRNLLGAVGFIDPTSPPVTEDDVLPAMCGVLAKQSSWLIAGEVYGIVPARFPDGQIHPAAVVWACTRAARRSATLRLQGQTPSRAVVREYGECGDVSSAACVVRDFWPRAWRTDAVGTSVYWLRATDGRVCFVEQKRYAEADPGREATCIWRYRQP